MRKLLKQSIGEDDQIFLKKLKPSDPRKRKIRTAKKASGKDVPKPFPIVGVGASAGGIEAFIKLIRHFDADLGMAYVLVMHLAPNHKSALAEILQSKTKMPVHTVEDGMEVMANNIYVIPPNRFMSLVNGHLRLAPRSLTTIGNYAVDYFLTALASVYKNNAIGVILSGTATDGTLGLKAIKAEGGITFAQDETAKFPGMPRSAYDAGYVDFLLPPEEIAKELARLVHVPYTILPSDKIEAVQSKELSDHAEDLKTILTIVKGKSGVDFFLNYKHASVYRRITRRMVLNKCENLSAYIAMLKKTPKEVDALYDDFLINVTSFFRDAEFFKTLHKLIFPSLIKERKAGDAIRIWVAGCSTGEEAYSIAISLLEFLKERDVDFPIQIFASDLDEFAIEKARLGIFAMTALQGVPLNLLAKYFKRIDGHYQINKAVRELCVFSQQNLLKDPPFSRLDLISCQNVLIYLEVIPQARILQTFHYALKASGFLFLGKSESTGTSSELFEPLDKKIKVFSRKATASPQLEFAVHSGGNGSPKERELADEKVEADVEKDIRKLILSRYVPPCILVNKALTIVQFFGLIGPYLEPVTGKASFNVLKIIREDLVIHLGSLLQQARKTGNVAVKEGVPIRINDVPKEITIEVAPRKQASGDILFLVVFKDSAGPEEQSQGRVPKSKKRNKPGKEIIRLEQQLSESRALIRASNEEHETTYEHEQQCA